MPSRDAVLVLLVTATPHIGAIFLWGTDLACRYGDFEYSHPTERQEFPQVLPEVLGVVVEVDELEDLPACREDVGLGPVEDGKGGAPHPDCEVGPSLEDGGGDVRDLGGVVLPLAVEDDESLDSLLPQELGPDEEGICLARTPVELDDMGSCHFREEGGAVGGAGVHDHDVVSIEEGLEDHGPDGMFLVVGEDEDAEPGLQDRCPGLVGYRYLVAGGVVDGDGPVDEELPELLVEAFVEGFRRRWRFENRHAEWCWRYAVDGSGLCSMRRKGWPPRKTALL